MWYVVPLILIPIYQIVLWQRKVRDEGKRRDKLSHLPMIDYPRDHDIKLSPQVKLKNYVGPTLRWASSTIFLIDEFSIILL